MDDFNIWGRSSKGRKKKQEPNILGGCFDLLRTLKNSHKSEFFNKLCMII